MRKFWRRVFVWDLDAQRYDVVFDNEVSAFDAFQCAVEGPTWCSLPQPYIYEQWWSFTSSTYGTDPGRWNYLGGRINWGTNPEVR